jgi:hypothetical protein
MAGVHRNANERGQKINTQHGRTGKYHRAIQRLGVELEKGHTQAHKGRTTTVDNMVVFA